MSCKNVKPLIIDYLAKADVDDKENDIVISMENIHKTYLMGVEGVPALRFVNIVVIIFC